MAADLALLAVFVQLFDLATCDIDFHNFRPAVDATPHPQSFKCFTCEQATDNYSCNRWAEDVWCPQNTQYCMTVHHISHHGMTKFVTKRCAAQAECQLAGCRHHKITHHTECVSCCEGMVCNVELPTNHTNAVFAFRQTQNSSESFRTCTFLTLVIASLTALMSL